MQSHEAPLGVAALAVDRHRAVEIAHIAVAGIEDVHGIVAQLDLADPVGQLGHVVTAVDDRAVGNGVAACQVLDGRELALPAIGEALGPIVLEVVDDTVEGHGTVGVRVHVADHQPQFVTVAPIVVAVAHGDILAIAVCIGGHEVGLQAEVVPVAPHVDDVRAASLPLEAQFVRAVGRAVVGYDMAYAEAGTLVDHPFDGLLDIFPAVVGQGYYADFWSHGFFFLKI